MNTNWMDLRGHWWFPIPHLSVPWMLLQCQSPGPQLAGRPVPIPLESFCLSRPHTMTAVTTAWPCCAPSTSSCWPNPWLAGILSKLCQRQCHCPGLTGQVSHKRAVPSPCCLALKSTCSDTMQHSHCVPKFQCIEVIDRSKSKLCKHPLQTF